MDANHDTIAAIATPPGRGGVGIIRISGAEAPTLAKKLIYKDSPSRELKARHAMFCSFLDQGGATIDRGLLIYFPCPASYTGEAVVELHGHGGRTVMSVLLERVIALGARQARPGEFTERAFLNNKMDLAQAEAVAGLIDSVSAQAARSAMRSLEGKFSDSVNDLRQKLISLRVFVESTLDFPEEEIDFILSEEVKEKLSDCVEEVERFLANATQGSVLGEGLQLAIVGSPNVGKSSLLNCLAGRDAAIVSSSPGTTRDIISNMVLVDGAPLNILDTAGIRKTDDGLEEEGIKRALNAASNADILLFLEEYKKNSDKEELAALKELPENVKRIVVRNKIDLAANKDELLEKNKDSSEIFLSAKTGEGVDALLQRFKEVMGLSETSEDVCMARARHLDALDKTLAHLTSGQQHLENKSTLELLAEDLRLAQESLGTITGSFVADDLLGEIFSRFCIGK